MLLGDMFERFILDAPMPVLFRLLMEQALDPEELDRMFERVQSRQCQGFAGNLGGFHPQGGVSPCPNRSATIERWTYFS